MSIDLNKTVYSATKVHSYKESAEFSSNWKISEIIYHAAFIILILMETKRELENTQLAFTWYNSRAVNEPHLVSKGYFLR